MSTDPAPGQSTLMDMADALNRITDPPPNYDEEKSDGA